MEVRPTEIDLHILAAEILNSSASKALPCNLSDFWLERLSAALEKGLEDTSARQDDCLAGPLAVVLHLLRGKSGSTEIVVEEADLFGYLVDYRIELALEEVSRRTEIQVSQATLESIFSENRVVIATRASPNGAK